MEKVKYLILGAGPAGLTFANRLKQSGEDSFLVVEKETEAGGLNNLAQTESAKRFIGRGYLPSMSKGAEHDAKWWRCV